MKIFICDDDYFVCRFVEQVILEYAQLNNIHIEVDIAQSKNSLFKNFEEDTDMLFLDIMLPDSTGIEIGHFLRKGRKNLNLQIVFISSNPSYALELFKIRPMDFLIKPFSSKDVTDILDEYSRFHLSQRNYFVYKSKQVTGKILYNDIIYFSSNIRKIDIFLKNGQIITIYGKLSDIEPRLSNAVFWRIHQSFIVNKYFIANCRYDCLELVNDIMLPISKNFRKDIREKILNE